MWPPFVLSHVWFLWKGGKLGSPKIERYNFFSHLLNEVKGLQEFKAFTAETSNCLLSLTKVKSNEEQEVCIYKEREKTESTRKIKTVNLQTNDKTGL